MPVQESNRIGEIRFGEGLGELLHQNPIALCPPELLDPSVNVLVADVQDTKAQSDRLAGHVGGGERSADDELRLPSFNALVVLAVERIAINACPLGILLEQGTHGVMGADLLPIDHGWLHERLVDMGAVTVFS